MAIDKLRRHERRKSRVRYKLKKINIANASKNNIEIKPRLSIFRSNKHIYAQIIDDTKGITLASASSIENALKEITGKLSIKALDVGKLIGNRAKALGITDVVYDKGGYKYHGVVLNVIEAARECFAN